MYWISTSSSSSSSSSCDHRRVHSGPSLVPGDRILFFLFRVFIISVIFTAYLLHFYYNLHSHSLTQAVRAHRMCFYDLIFCRDFNPTKERRWEYNEIAIRARTKYISLSLSPSALKVVASLSLMTTMTFIFTGFMFCAMHFPSLPSSKGAEAETRFTNCYWILFINTFASDYGLWKSTKPKRMFRCTNQVYELQTPGTLWFSMIFIIIIISILDTI